MIRTSWSIAQYARNRGRVRAGTIALVIRHTEERGAKFGHEFFDGVAFGPDTRGAKVARQARFVGGPVGGESQFLLRTGREALAFL